MPEHLDLPGGNFPDNYYHSLPRFTPGPDFLPGGPSLSSPDYTHAGMPDALQPFSQPDYLTPPVMRHHSEDSGDSGVFGHDAPGEGYHSYRQPAAHDYIPEHSDDSPAHGHVYYSQQAHEGTETDSADDADTTEHSEAAQPAAGEHSADDPYMTEAWGIMADVGIQPLADFDPGHDLLAQALARTLEQNARAAQEAHRQPHPDSASDEQLQPGDNSTTVDFSGPLVDTRRSYSPTDAQRFYKGAQNPPQPLPARQPRRPEGLDDLDRRAQQELTAQLPQDEAVTTVPIQTPPELLPQQHVEVSSASEDIHAQGPEAALARLRERLTKANQNPGMYTKEEVASLPWQIEYLEDELYGAPSQPVVTVNKEGQHIIEIEFGQAVPEDVLGVKEVEAAKDEALEKILGRLRKL